MPGQELTRSAGAGREEHEVPAAARRSQRRPFGGSSFLGYMDQQWGDSARRGQGDGGGGGGDGIGGGQPACPPGGGSRIGYHHPLSMALAVLAAERPPSAAEAESHLRDLLVKIDYQRPPG
jgi:hypothetical protein